MKHTIHSRHLLFLLISILSLLPTTVKAEVDNGYRIDSYNYSAIVHADKTWDVTETITVTFLEDRHGIYRFIPRRYVISQLTNGSVANYTYYTSIRNIKVPGYNFEIEAKDDSQDNVLIRIGNEKKTLTGQHTYKISYTLEYPEDRHATDALYCTVLGPDWNTSIDYFAFNIRFDKALPSTVAPLLQVLSGEWGCEGNDLGVKINVANKEISGNVSHISPNKGITLHAEMPKGYWEGGASVSSFSFFLCLSIMAACFVLLMFYIIFHRRKRPMMVLEYSAPDGISSAEVGVIIDNSADLSDLNSLIVWFASKGYLKIRDIEQDNDSDIELIKLRELPDNAPEYQKLYWQVFFEKQDKVLLSELGNRHNFISQAVLELSRHFHGKTSLTHTHWLSVFIFLIYLCLGAFTFSMSSKVQKFDDDVSIFGFALWALPVFFAFLIRIHMSNRDMITKFRSRFTQYLIILLLGVASVGIFYLFFWKQNDSFLTFPIAASIIMSGWIIAMFSGRMVRDSEYRKEKMSLLLGFKEFIEKSEMPMLKQQVDENPSYFFDVLPYAMVFGLTKKWQKKFKDIDIQAPDWYETTNTTRNINGLMAANNISHAMSHNISHAISIASHDPNVHSGSNGSSGGFAGGGGGGGGGGSW